VTAKRISVFAPMGTVDHQTGILNAARGFAEAGYAVDFYTVRNRRYTLPAFAAPGVRVHVLPVAFDSEPEPRWVVTLLFALWVLALFWRPQRLVFAGGVRGLFAAWLLSLVRRVDIVNYQTELYIGDKLNTRAARVFKAIERSAARRSMLTIEHDAQRRELLIEDLGVARERVVVVPNAPFGPARAHASNFLHRRLGLADTTRIVLCPGTLGETFASRAVVRAAQHLEPPWLCVLHSAQPRAADDPYLQSLRALNTRGRVALSLDPIPYEQIDELLGSAAAGLVLYAADLGQNTATVGLASGKLSHFLKLGVPVVVSPLPGLADFVLEHRVGLVLDEEAALPLRLEALAADADGYRERALACFDRHLSYGAAFAQVLAVTDRRAAGGQP
jgi:glycosyltransferase involved in cell wall biosynthesis